MLRSEKDTLESVLTMKTSDVKKTLSNELVRIEEEMYECETTQEAALQLPEGREQSYSTADYGAQGRKDGSPAAAVRPPATHHRTRNADRQRIERLRLIATSIVEHIRCSSRVTNID